MTDFKMKLIGAKHFWSLCFLGLSLTACLAPAANAPPLTPEPTPTIDRLAAPPMPEVPSQADRGAYVYWQVCMACHGDRGQGLTDEWRAVWEEDGDCWQSGCHGVDHPPEGFSHPRYHPPIIGPDTLTRFDNALELHDYIAKAMPWWKPGYLKPEEYWELTAFLMRAHNALPEGVTLEAGNAALFRLRPIAPLPENPRPAALLLAAILLLAAGVLAVQNRLRR
jgi:mono/diheme cytochrome c family protein